MNNALLRKAVWYRNRFASMSSEEVFHRLEEAVKKRIDQFAEPSAAKRLGQFRPLPGLRDCAEKLSPEILAEWETDYRRIREGKLNILNKEWPTCDSGFPWHLDPVTGKTWPQDRYAFQIDYRHNDTMGDVKYVWEINRLQFLPPIAALACARKDPDIAHFCLQIIESWIDSNPPYLGINWASGIELAIRAINILAVLTFTGEYMDPRQRAKIANSLQAHGERLERYPSLHSSANNHRAAEGLGLFVIGSLCPALNRATRWREEGWNILCKSAETQILPDGASAEQAVSYGAITLEMLKLGAHIAHEDGHDIPYGYRNALARGYEFLSWITDRNDNRPQIGDDDNGFILDANLRALFLPTPIPIPTEGVRTFTEGGYTISRQRIKDRDLLLIFDHGHLGFPPLAAHGHADALSVWLHIDGQPVFIDAGTYLYHSGGADRDAFRGTAAHNTLCIEGANSSAISGPFNWSHKAEARITSTHIEEEEWQVEAEHDGYWRKFGALHRRRVTFAMKSGFTITDWLLGSSTHKVSIGYLLHPDLTIRKDGEDLIVAKNGHDLLQLAFAGDLACEVEENADYSPSFGIKQKTHRIVFKGKQQPGRLFTLTCVPLP